MRKQDVSGRRGHKQIKRGACGVNRYFQGKGGINRFFVNCEFRGFFYEGQGDVTVTNQR